jgi:hypothetical protein
MAKMMPSRTNVLIELAATPMVFVPANRLPDGNGMAGRASGVKLRSMKAAGLIEYGKNDSHSHYGYRITEAGRAALHETGR